MHTPIEKLALYIVRQTELYCDEFEEEFSAGEIIGAYEVAKLEMTARGLNAAGFVLMERGIDKATEQELLGELPTITGEDGEEIELDDDDDEEEAED
jgi:hypothetical protein